MGLATCLCKSFLGFLNMTFLAIGLCLAVLGILLQVAAGSTLLEYFEDSIKDILANIGVLDGSTFIENVRFQDLFEPLSVALIVVGLSVACIAFLGCCGSSCNYTIILVVYCVVLGALLATQIIVVSLFFSHSLDDDIQKQTNKTIVEHYGGIDDPGPASVIWNVLMLDLECCGLYGYKDFDHAERWNRTRRLMIGGQSTVVTLATPVACCATTGDFPKVTVVDPYCAVYPNDTVSNWNSGCWDAVSAELESHRTPAILVITAILVIQAIIIAMSIAVICDDGSKVSPA